MDNQNYTNQNDNSKTRVLSDDERRQFDGITIEESAGDVKVDERPTFEQERTQYEQGYEHFGSPRVKVIHLGGSNWLSRIILIAILAGIAAAIIFFGGIIITIIGVVMLVGAIISFIFGLF